MARSIQQLILLLLVVLPGTPGFAGGLLSGKQSPDHSANSSFMDWPIDDLDDRISLANHQPNLLGAIWDVPAIPNLQHISQPERLSTARTQTFRAYLLYHSFLI